MVTKKRYAIPDKVADIALKYGPNVSKGIQTMEEIISVLKPEDKSDD
jgi:hypothetical protein